jgi:hydrogenase expression/formation protein HypC
MCLAVPGKIVEIDGEDVTIDYRAEKRKAKAVGLDVKKGDYVIVSAGFVVTKVEKEEAERALSAISSL